MTSVEFRVFKLEELRDRGLSLLDATLWIDKIQIGLGIRQGQYEAKQIESKKLVELTLNEAIARV